MISQNSIIAVGLILGFIVFITVRGELPAYLGVLGLGASAAAPATTPAASPNQTPYNPLAGFGGLSNAGNANPFSNNPFVFVN